MDVLQRFYSRELSQNNMDGITVVNEDTADHAFKITNLENYKTLTEMRLTDIKEVLNKY